MIRITKTKIFREWGTKKLKIKNAKFLYSLISLTGSHVSATSPTPKAVAMRSAMRVREILLPYG